MIKDELYAGGGTHSLEDVKLMMKTKGTLPFFVFTDGLVDKLTVLTETLDNSDGNVSIYHKDDGSDVNEVSMLNISSNTAGLYSLYYIATDRGYLTSLPTAQTINDTFFKNQTIAMSSKVLPSNYVKDNGESIMFNNKDGVLSLPKPSNNFGNIVTVKTIRLAGVKTFSIPYRTKLDTDSGSIYIEDSLLPLLEIDATVFTDWDPKTIPFYTLVQNSNGTFTTKYVGPLDTDKYYIPLQ